MKLVLAVLGLVAIAVAAEGCGTSCESSAPNNFHACPADPNPTQNEIAACKMAQAGPCSGKYNDWVGCVTGKVKCDPTLRTADPQSKIDALKECQPKYDAYAQCASTTM